MPYSSFDKPDYVFIERRRDEQKDNCQSCVGMCVGRRIEWAGECFSIPLTLNIEG